MKKAHSPQSFSALIALVALLGLTSGTSLQAQAPETNAWNGNFDTNWNNPDNWSLHTVPGEDHPSYNIVISPTGRNNPVLTNPEYAGTPAGQLTLNKGGLTIGYGGSLQLTGDLKTAANTNLVVSNTGELSVDNLSISGVGIGNATNASAIFETGGLLAVAGNVTVADGTGTSGSLNLSSSVLSTIDGYLSTGNGTNSTAVVTIDKGSSLDITNGIFLSGGSGSQTTMTITEDAEVNVTINGVQVSGKQNSSSENTNAALGNATLNITSGARLLVDNGTVRVGAGGDGTLLVSGGNSTLRVFNEIHAGGGIGLAGETGHGIIRVEDNGLIRLMEGGLRLGNGTGATGEVHLASGGTLSFEGDNDTIPFSKGPGTGFIAMDGGGVLRATVTDVPYREWNVDLQISGEGNRLEGIPPEGESAEDRGIHLTGALSGDGELIKTGSSHLFLDGDSSGFSGRLVIDEGNLIFETLGSHTLPATWAEIVVNTKMVINDFSGEEIFFDSNISGEGSLILSSQSILTLSGSYSYAGITSITQGTTLNLQGSITGEGGAVYIDPFATLTGSGTVTRDIHVAKNGTLDSSIVYNGHVYFEDKGDSGDVSSGETVVVAPNETVNIGQATGGTIDATQGTVVMVTLDGATLQVGNFGATVETIRSGTVEASGGLNVTNLEGGTITMNELAQLRVKEGYFEGEIKGPGDLVKTDDGTLSIVHENTFMTGDTYVEGGLLQIAAVGALGEVPIVLLNNGRFQVLQNTHIGEGTVIAQEGTVYEKNYDEGENLSNLGDFSNGTGSASMTIGAGTSTGATDVEAWWSGDVLSLTGLNGTSFLLVMYAEIPPGINPQDFYIGWDNEGVWTLATNGNIAPEGSLAAFYAMSYQSFLEDKGGWNPVTMLGAYGTDIATGQVWAVVDHNSSFQVISPVPEPSTWMMLAAGAAALGYGRWRRRA